MSATPRKKPLVVCDSSGTPLDLVYENEKGYRKSIEQAVLWSLHEETAKLLPYQGRSDGAGAVSLIEIVDKGSWYQARVAATNQARGDALPRSHTPAAASPAATGVTREGDGVTLAAVLESLAAVIRQRNEARPEGSYTTHLFESGESKIRKKLGEEAVEVLLASDRQEFVSETADFLYHLLVLCEATGVALDDIANELRSR